MTAMQIAILLTVLEVWDRIRDIHAFHFISHSCSSGGYFWGYHVMIPFPIPPGSRADSHATPTTQGLLLLIYVSFIPSMPFLY